jgi:hypothetical protein
MFAFLRATPLAFVLAVAAFAGRSSAQTAGFYKTFCAGSGADGSIGVDCPCDNTVPRGTVAGCRNRTGYGASLVPSGNASIAHDTLVLTTSGAPTGSHGFFFHGSAARHTVQLGNGIRCIGSPLVRVAKVASSGGQDSIPPPTGPTLSQQLNATVGEVMFFQYLYRDLNGTCGYSTNASNAVLVIWGS